MEKIINNKIEQYSLSFKEKMKDKINSLNIYETDKLNKFIEFIDNYGPLVFEKGDLVNSKRIKIELAPNIRCTAKRICGKQCTRRKKVDCDYCGTHYKTLPNGVFDSDIQNIETTLSIDIFTKDIEGIIYHIDKNLNVYNTEDMLGEKLNPRIIGKVQEINNVFTIKLN